MQKAQEKRFVDIVSELVDMHTHIKCAHTDTQVTPHVHAASVKLEHAAR